MINPRPGKTQSTVLPIYTLSGGVGRQAPSKRLPSEAEELINALCSVERSVEKRPGTDLLPLIGQTPASYTGEALPLPAGGDYEFFWHALSDNARFLFVVDRNASVGSGREELFYTYFYDQANLQFIDRTQGSQNSAVPTDVREYITYAPPEGKENLHIVTRGQNLVFLNPGVHAGYTSKPLEVTQAMIDSNTGSIDGFGLGSTVNGSPRFTAGEIFWCQIGMDGEFIGNGNYVTDPIGLEVEYTTATNVDPEGIATYWDQYSTFVSGTTVLYLWGTSSVQDANLLAAGYVAGEDVIFNCIDSVSVPDGNSTQGLDDTDYWTVVAVEGSTDDRAPNQVPVQNWEYPDPTTPQLGQSLVTFNDLTIPPLEVDVTDGNNSAEDMLEALYGLEDPPATGPTNAATGKVYFIQTGYLGQSPGYYIAKSVISPYFQKVRTPDGYSVLDKKRLPMQLQFVGGSSLTDQWEWSTVEWDQRTSGDKDNNPGPTPFREGRQSKLATIAFYRNRLWLSSGDVLFSSREGQFSDLWLENPGQLVDTDPIDIAASTNTFTPVTAMVPFKDYMFVNTNADVQYELMGSENQITPFTAELQPMTFYSTAPLVDPLTLGNYIFFFDAERLYLYMGKGGTLSTAQELSSHCPKYLPENYGSATVAAAQDTILVVDADSPSEVYLYTTKYRGDSIAQNAFYKFSYEDAAVTSLKAWDNYAYMVVERADGFFIERQHMRYDDVDIPLIDRKQKLALTLGSSLSGDRDLANMTFNSSTLTTTIRVPYAMDPLKEYEVLSMAGVSYEIESFAVTPGQYTDITISADLTSESNIWIGRRFTMVVQLSTQFVRNEQNNSQQGILNLATMRTSHFETGNYDVVVQRRGRPVSDIISEYESNTSALDNYKTSFVAPRTDAYETSVLPISNVEYEGELVSKVMGYSEKVDIFILSDYFTPANITNIEFRGKFTTKYSSVL
jgi:hypothetical protein